MPHDSDVIDSPSIIVHRDGAVVHCKLNRPRRYNSLDSGLLRDLLERLDDRRPGDQVLILEGGHSAFSVGSDIRELAAMDASQAEAYSLLGHRVLERLESWPGMTVAVLHGYVIGAALELVLGCDLLAGSPDVQLGMPGLAWALLPVMGGLRRLSQRCSPDLARRIFLGGDILDASAAHEQGLLNRILRQEDDYDIFIEEALEWSPGAVLAIRELRLRGLGIDSRNEAGIFAAGFRNGECQRRLHELMDS